MDLIDPRVIRHAFFWLLLAVMTLGLLRTIRGIDAMPNRSRSIAWIAALIYALMALQHVISPPQDDESRRLVAVQSFLSDGDFDLSDEYRSETWREFHTGGPAFFTDAARAIKNNLDSRPHPFYPRYAVGYTILMAPFYALGAPLHPALGRFLAVLPSMASSILSLLLLVEALVSRGADEKTARRLAAAFALTAPWMYFAVHLWPEPIAGVAALWICGRKHPTTGYAGLAVGALAAFLPLLHFRYAFLSVPCLMHFAWANRRSKRVLLAAGAGVLPPLTASLLSYAVSCDYETWSIWVGIDARSPAGNRLGAFEALQLLDLDLLMSRLVLPPAGIVLLVPAIVIGVGAISWRRAWPALPMIAAILTYDYASGPLARFWVPVLPLLAAAAAPLDAESRVTRFALAWGALAGVALCINPWLCADTMSPGRLLAILTREFGG